jgi:hypothetical protein
MAFAWHGFENFILDTTPEFTNDIKKDILCIFANKLYDKVNATDYYFRLLNAIVIDLDAKHTGKTFKVVWDTFINNIRANNNLIKDIAEKLIILGGRNNYFANAADVTNALTIGYTTGINSINKSDAPTGTDTYISLSKNLDSAANASINKYNKLLFDWKGFDDIFVKITDADARTYICNYFINELSAAKIPNANKNTDAFILLMYIIKKNKDATKGDVGNLQTAVSSDNTNTLIKTIAEKLKYLFEYTDITTNIATKTKDALKCFKSDELVPTTPAHAHALPTFDKDTLPSGWTNYELLNVLSYDVAVDDATKGTTLPNIRTFLTDIVTNAKTPGTAYNEFAPNIITLQNTAELIKTGTIAMPNRNVEQNTDNTLVTIIHNDIYSNTKGNDKIDGDNFYQYSFNANLKYIIINVVNPTSAISSATIINGIFPAIQLKIGYDPTTFSCLLVISGAVSGDFESQLTKTPLKFEKLNTIYDKKVIKNLHIYTKYFGGNDLFDFVTNISTKVAFENNYSKSRPVGVRLFLKLDSTKLKSSKPKHTGAVTMGNVHTVLATELAGLDVAVLEKLLKSISAPIGKSVKAKASSKTKGKAPVAATPPATPTPPAVKKINIYNIKSINMHQANSKEAAIPKVADFTFCDGTYKEFKIGKPGKEKPKIIDIIYDNTGTISKGAVFKKDGEDKYCIKVKIGTGNHAIHDILIKNNEVYFKDTSPPDFTEYNITPYVTV